MLLLSFDIGIRNMAYCLLCVGNDGVEILDWNVLNLIIDEDKNENEDEVPVCSNQKTCSRKAVYSCSSRFFCQRHARQIALPFRISSSSSSSSSSSFLGSWKTLSKEEIETRCRAEQLPLPSLHIKTKTAWLDHLNTTLPLFTLLPLPEKKKKNAADIDLITLGRVLKQQLDVQLMPVVQALNVPLTHVILENQISPLATRMKAIQGMLTQYFIMMFPASLHIEYISSFNKLKGFHLLNAETTTRTYSQHKKDAVAICQRFVENNPAWRSWMPKLTTVKKDDLADSCLQAVWYLKHKNIITYSMDTLSLSIASNSS